MIKFEKNKMTKHEVLTKEEAIIFCFFLQSEFERHLDDANMITKRMHEMESKHLFNTYDEMKKRGLIYND